MKRTITRERDGEYCRLEIELRDGRLSVCGTAGHVLTERAARKDALEFWRTFFEDSPSELTAMNDRLGTRFRSANSAARYVVQTDGEFHGLDVMCERDGKVYVVHSCGQITKEIRKWFPESIPLLAWHLNDMHASCEHQDARGETYETNPSAVCPDCGWKLGHGWHKRELPASIVALAETVCGEPAPIVACPDRYHHHLGSTCNVCGMKD